MMVSTIFDALKAAETRGTSLRVRLIHLSEYCERAVSDPDITLGGTDFMTKLFFTTSEPSYDKLASVSTAIEGGTVEERRALSEIGQRGNRRDCSESRAIIAE